LEALPEGQKPVGLGLLGGLEAATPVLLRHLEGDGRPALASLRALGVLAPEPFLRLLPTLTEHPSVQIRLEAARLCGRHRVGEAALRALLRSREAYLRTAAQVALSKFAP
jgi:hypothetical protein